MKLSPLDIAAVQLIGLAMREVVAPALASMDFRLLHDVLCGGQKRGAEIGIDHTLIFQQNTVLHDFALAMMEFNAAHPGAWNTLLQVPPDAEREYIQRKVAEAGGTAAFVKQDGSETPPSDSGSTLH